MFLNIFLPNYDWLHSHKHTRQGYREATSFQTDLIPIMGQVTYVQSSIGTRKKCYAHIISPETTRSMNSYTKAKSLDCKFKFGIPFIPTQQLDQRAPGGWGEGEFQIQMGLELLMGRCVAQESCQTGIGTGLLQGDW